MVDERLGHELMARAEQAKIDVADGGATTIDLGHIERRLAAALTEQQAVDAIEADIERIVGAAREAVRRPGCEPEQVDALYFTGGSTGLRLLAERIAAAFPQRKSCAATASPASRPGLGLHAQRWFGKV